MTNKKLKNKKLRSYVRDGWYRSLHAYAISVGKQKEKIGKKSDRLYELYEKIQTEKITLPHEMLKAIILAKKFKKFPRI